MARARLAPVLTALALLAFPTPGRAQPQPQPYRFNDYGGGGFHDVLPAGANGLVTAPQLAAYEANNSSRPPHSDDQLGMYESLLYGYRGLSAAALSRYYKDSSFGVAPGDVGPVTSPRPDVTIVRDRSFGVPHVYGSTRAGTMFGLGYAGAQDRLFFMDVLRHAGRAQLAAFVGGAQGNRAMDQQEMLVAPYSEADFRQQLDDLPKLYGAEGQAVLDDIDNFVAGVNQYIDEAKLDPTKMPAEYAALGKPQGPEPWQPTDVVSEAALVGGIFGKGGGDQLEWAQILEAFQQRFGTGAGTTLFTDWRERNDPEAPTTVGGRSFPYELPPAHPAPDAQELPDPGSVTPVNVVASSTPTSVPVAGLGSALLAFPRDDSNALLVSAGHSADGHPLAVFGPQVAYFNPQILMEEDVHGPGIDVRGAAFDGVNFYVELGHGRDYAWSATSSPHDIIHVFALTLCNPDGTPASKDSNYYVFRGQCLPMDPLTVTDTWTPNPADQTPPGSQTLMVRRTKLGIVIARATVGGRPVAYTQLRSTYMHEIDSARGFRDFNDPGVIRSAADFQRAAYKIGYDFNWFYTDDRDIAYFDSGNNPVADPRVDPTLPVNSRYEWQGFNPDLNTATYTPFEAHPQVVNPDYLTSWNNKEAPQYTSSDSNYQSLYRSQLLDDRIRPLIAGARKTTLPELVGAMEDAATVDLRADYDLPLVLRVIGTPSDPQLAQAVGQLASWVADGSHRLDPTRSGSYQHSAAIAIMDAWWPLLVQGEFEPALGPDLYRQLTGHLALDNPPNNDGPGTVHVGSAYQDGWYGYVHKDLRALLGLPEQGAFHRVYCGGGSLAACRSMLETTLRQGISAAANRNQLYADSTCSSMGRSGDQECFDGIVFRPVGAISQPLVPWVNRPTYQQAIDIVAHRPRPAQQPSSTCASGRTVILHLRGRRFARVRRVAVHVNGRRLPSARPVRRRLAINLSGLTGTVRVQVRVVTRRGRFTLRRTYHLCAARRGPGQGQGRG